MRLIYRTRSWKLERMHSKHGFPRQATVRGRQHSAHVCLACANSQVSMELTLRRCFQKAGFIPEIPLIDEVDENADHDPLLSMEADV